MRRSLDRLSLPLEASTSRVCINRRTRNRFHIDYLESPAAAPSADLHVRESASDEEAVLCCAVGHKASLVISTCVNQANLVACRVSHELGLPAPYSTETAMQVTNKGLTAHRLAAHGIPTSSFVVGALWQHFASHQLQFPLVVKPADSNGSKGIVKIELPERLKRAVEVALEISRSHEAIVEEWFDGGEIAFGSFVVDGRVRFLLSRARRKIRHLDGSTDVQQITESIWPAQIAGHGLVDLKRLAGRIVAAF